MTNSALMPGDYFIFLDEDESGNTGYGIVLPHNLAFLVTSAYERFDFIPDDAVQCTNIQNIPANTKEGLDNATEAFYKPD